MLLSIIPNSASPITSAIAGVIALLLVVCVWKCRKSPHRLSSSEIFFALSLCLLYYLFPMSGSDYFAYKEWVEGIGYIDVTQIPQFYLHYEKPYYVIVNFVQNNYLLFRLVVWGTSLLLYWQTARRLELDKSSFTFYLCICIVQLSAVSRVCLAYALAYFGFSFLIKPITRRGSNIMSFVLGAAIVAVSLFFHRSAIYLLAILPISLFIFNKKTIWLFAFAFPALVVLINTNLLDFLFSYDQSETSILDADTAMLYLDSDRKRTVGIGQGIEFILKYGSHVAIVVLIIKSILNKSYNAWPKHIQKFANATFFVTVFASSLLFSTDATTYKTFERLIAFAYVPQSIMLAYLLKQDYEKKTVNIATLLIAGYVVYSILYYNFHLA